MRHILTALHRALIAAMTFGFTACGDGVLGPLNDEIFVLRTVAEDSLPAIVDDLGGPWTIIADTIWFHSGSDWRRRQVHRRGLSTGNDLVEWETDGFVIRYDGEIILPSTVLIPLTASFRTGSCPMGPCSRWRVPACTPA